VGGRLPLYQAFDFRHERVVLGDRVEPPVQHCADGAATRAELEEEARVRARHFEPTPDQRLDLGVGVERVRVEALDGEEALGRF